MGRIVAQLLQGDQREITADSTERLTVALATEGDLEELAGCHDGNALKRSEPEQMTVAGHDVVRGALDGSLEDAVVALVADGRDHASGDDNDAARFNEIHE